MYTGHGGPFRSRKHCDCEGVRRNGSGVISWLECPADHNLRSRVRPRHISNLMMNNLVILRKICKIFIDLLLKYNCGWIPVQKSAHISTHHLTVYLWYPYQPSSTQKPSEVPWFINFMPLTFLPLKSLLHSYLPGEDICTLSPHVMFWCSLSHLLVFIQAGPYRRQTSPWEIFWLLSVVY